jgi:ABC-type hemin transport system substrate-binding protein
MSSRPLPRAIAIGVFSSVVIVSTSCSRFFNASADVQGERIVVLAKQYNEIIWALGAQQHVVGVDISSTYPLRSHDCRPWDTTAL